MRGEEGEDHRGAEQVRAKKKIFGHAAVAY
jgi:hypothetical protein